MFDTTYKIHRAYTPLGTDSVTTPYPIFEYEMENRPCDADENGMHLEDGGLNTDRFGFVNCARCYVPLAWSRGFVREGVFSEGTHVWARDIERGHFDDLMELLRPLPDLDIQPMSRLQQDIEAGLACYIAA